MKAGIFLVFVASSSATILKYDPNADYPGKVAEFLTEEAVSNLCAKMEEHAEEHTGEHFYDVALPQAKGSTIMWWKRGSRRMAIATHTYATGCYRWEMRPCYGYYPSTFNDPCTFWIPKEYPDAKCVYDFEKGDASIGQKAVTLTGRSAAQLCDSAVQAMGKKFFSMLFIPLKMNLKSDHRCETWTYTPGGDDDDDGKWESSTISQAECDTKFPEYNIEELEDPNKSHVQCLPSISGEFECFFDDENMPMEKQIEIQDKPTSMMT